MGVLVLAVAYVVGMFWTRYGLESVTFGWLFVGVALPITIAVVGPSGQWDRRLVLALVALGVLAIVDGIIGSGVVGTMGPMSRGGAPWVVEYDWGTNTLRFGRTSPSGTPPKHVQPNRRSVLIGTLALAVGLYGRLPRRWLTQ